MVQQISYAQEIKGLVETQEVAVNNSLKALFPFLKKQGLLSGGEFCCVSHILIKEDIIRFYLEIVI